MHKKIKHIMYILLFSFLLLTCTACGANEKQLSKSDAGEPYSDWEKSPAGSAKYLDGDTVLVSIFLEDTDADWTKADRTLAKENLEIACTFLKEQGRRYGMDVNLIYDTDEHPNLEYHYHTDSAFYGSTSTNAEGADGLLAKQLYANVNSYISTNIDIETILSSYGVNSIGFVVFIDGETAQATAYPYYSWGEANYYSEVCFINLRWAGSGADVAPDTYAHELLHLFGARDLYRSSEADSITKAYVDYVYKKYPKDIMLGSARKGVLWHDRISGEISDVTAYYLGWIDTIYEVELFPDTEADYKASFTYREPSGDFEEYTAASRRISERIFKYSLLYVFIFEFIIVYDIYKLAKGRKMNTQIPLNTQLPPNEQKEEDSSCQFR